jgi:hypothetical protein
VSKEKPQNGPWGRKLWNAVAILTAIGLIGPVTFLLKVWPAVQQTNASHCDTPPYFVYGLIEFFLTWLVVLAGMAGLGLLMFWLRSPAGLLVLVFCNLVMMAFYGFAHPINPGELIWGLVVVGIAAAPAIAAAIALWPLLTRWALWVRVVELVIITLIALPVLWLYGSGLGNDIQTALSTPPAAHPLAVSQGPTPGGCAVRPGSL